MTEGKDSPRPPFEAVVALGRYFVAHEMRAHAELLRAYVRWRRGGAASNWDDAMVAGWLAILRIPPCEHVYEVRPSMSPCATCGPGSPKYTRTVFPDGAVVWCGWCQREWIELHREETK